MEHNAEPRRSPLGSSAFTGHQDDDEFFEQGGGRRLLGRDGAADGEWMADGSPSAAADLPSPAVAAVLVVAVTFVLVFVLRRRWRHFAVLIMRWLPIGSASAQHEGFAFPNGGQVRVRTLTTYRERIVRDRASTGSSAECSLVSATYDFVVVGAGPAGLSAAATLARELSLPTASILLLERGRAVDAEGYTSAVSCPALFYKLNSSALGVQCVDVIRGAAFPLLNGGATAPPQQQVTVVRAGQGIGGGALRDWLTWDVTRGEAVSGPSDPMAISPPAPASWPSVPAPCASSCPPAPVGVSVGVHRSPFAWAFGFGIGKVIAPTQSPVATAASDGADGDQEEEAAQRESSSALRRMLQQWRAQLRPHWVRTISSSSPSVAGRRVPLWSVFKATLLNPCRNGMTMEPTTLAPSERHVTIDMVTGACVSGFTTDDARVVRDVQCLPAVPHQRASDVGKNVQPATSFGVRHAVMLAAGCHATNKLLRQVKAASGGTSGGAKGGPPPQPIDRGAARDSVSVSFVYQALPGVSCDPVNVATKWTLLTHTLRQMFRATASDPMPVRPTLPCASTAPGQFVEPPLVVPVDTSLELRIQTQSSSASASSCVVRSFAVCVELLPIGQHDGDVYASIGLPVKTLGLFGEGYCLRITARPLLMGSDDHQFRPSPQATTGAGEGGPPTGDDPAVTSGLTTVNEERCLLKALMAAAHGVREIVRLQPLCYLGTGKEAVDVDVLCQAAVALGATTTAAGTANPDRINAARSVAALSVMAGAAIMPPPFASTMGDAEETEKEERGGAASSLWVSHSQSSEATMGHDGVDDPASIVPSVGDQPLTADERKYFPPTAEIVKRFLYAKAKREPRTEGERRALDATRDAIRRVASSSHYLAAYVLKHSRFDGRPYGGAEWAIASTGNLSDREEITGQLPTAANAIARNLFVADSAALRSLDDVDMVLNHNHNNDDNNDSAGCGRGAGALSLSSDAHGPGVATAWALGAAAARAAMLSAAA